MAPFPCPAALRVNRSSARKPPALPPSPWIRELTANSEPVHLVLKPGKLLRLRVVDSAGNPVPQATLWYDHVNSGHANPVQVDYSAITDAQGRAAWTNAPDAEMTFSAQARGYAQREYSIRPDGEEHLITLARIPKAVVAHGVVWDAATGLRIPKFRILSGWEDGHTVFTNIHWHTTAGTWQDFAGGTYRYSFENEADGDPKNGGYVLKFTADGHMPLISRVIGPEEGEVELNVSLQPAAAVTVSVLNPDGRPATGTDIGLVFPGPVWR